MSNDAAVGSLWMAAMLFCGVGPIWPCAGGVSIVRGPNNSVYNTTDAPPGTTTEAPNFTTFTPKETDTILPTINANAASGDGIESAPLVRATGAVNADGNGEATLKTSTKTTYAISEDSRTVYQDLVVEDGEGVSAVYSNTNAEIFDDLVVEEPHNSTQSASAISTTTVPSMTSSSSLSLTTVASHTSSSRRAVTSMTEDDGIVNGASESPGISTNSSFGEISRTGTTVNGTASISSSRSNISNSSSSSSSSSATSTITTTTISTITLSSSTASSNTTTTARFTITSPINSNPNTSTRPPTTTTTTTSTTTPTPTTTNDDDDDGVEEDKYNPGVTYVCVVIASVLAVLFVIGVVFIWIKLKPKSLSYYLQDAAQEVRYSRIA